MQQTDLPMIRQLMRIAPVFNPAHYFHFYIIQNTNQEARGLMLAVDAGGHSQRVKGAVTFLALWFGAPRLS